MQKIDQLHSFFKTAGNAAETSAGTDDGLFMPQDLTADILKEQPDPLPNLSNPRLAGSRNPMRRAVIAGILAGGVGGLAGYGLANKLTGYEAGKHLDRPTIPEDEAGQHRAQLVGATAGALALGVPTAMLVHTSQDSVGTLSTVREMERRRRLAVLMRRLNIDPEKGDWKFKI